MMVISQANDCGLGAVWVSRYAQAHFSSYTYTEKTRLRVLEGKLHSHTRNTLFNTGNGVQLQYTARVFLEVMSHMTPL